MESDDYTYGSYSSAVAKLARHNINIIHIYQDEASAPVSVDFEFQWRPRPSTPTKWTKMSMPLHQGITFPELANSLVAMVQEVRSEIEGR